MTPTWPTGHKTPREGGLKTHELKTWERPFQAVWDGLKLHEVRVNDRGFEVGGVLYLREWDVGLQKYSGRGIRAEVTYITPGGYWGLPKELCVMSIKVTGKEQVQL